MGSMIPILYILGTLAVLAGAWFGWIALMRRVYRLRRPPATPVYVVASDGWKLTMFHRKPSTRRFEEPVLLCHGLAANHRNLDFEPPWSLAAYLADAGFECFSVDWRGTGRSRTPPRGRRGTDYDIDDHIREDGPAFLKAALEQTGAKRAFWVGHSLGGLVGYAVAEGPAASLLKGVVTVGSPAFFGYPRFMANLLRAGRVLAWPFALRQRVMSVATAPFLGHVTLPLTDIVFNPKHIPAPQQRKIYAQVISSIGRKILIQFDDWLEHDVFRSFDGKIDYRAAMAEIRVPVLVTGGSADRLAPPGAVHRAYETLGSEDKTLMVFGPENGDQMEYGHGDLIFGERAPEEVFPRIRRWLEARAELTTS